MKLPFGWALIRMPTRATLKGKALVIFPAVGVEDTTETVSVKCEGGFEFESGELCMKVVLHFNKIVHAILFRDNKTDKEIHDGNRIE